MLRVRNLQVGYGHFVLRASFSLKNSSSVAILGPSGSGKTTLINAIAGFLPVDIGDVEWKGDNITGLPWREACEYIVSGAQFISSPNR